MKNIIYSIILLLISTNILATIELYITDDDFKPHPISDMYSILDRLSQDDSDKDILFYVHGRKKLLSKEIARMNALEAKYNVKVVMLRWDSYDTLITRPVQNAQIAASSLYESFESIKRFKNDHREFFKTHMINLLCHSMGNVILKFTIEEFYLNNPSKEKIFSNFISVGADVPLKDHSTWLKNFNIVENKFIMMNNHDGVLSLSYLLDLKNGIPQFYRLGLGFDNLVGLREDILKNLDSQSNYIDLSPILHSDHGYFLSENKIVSQIFTKLFAGTDFTKKPLISGRITQKVNAKNVFSISN